MRPISSYRSPKTEVRNDKSIQGKGFFAKRAIKKGEIVFIKSGHIVDGQTAKKLEGRLGEYCLQIEDNFFVCPTDDEEVKSTTIYINHSCQPNVGAAGQISFIALRDISAGEELCADYAMTTARPYSLKCSCGTNDCRRIITGEDWKRPDLQEKYWPYFVDFIKAKISMK